MKIDIASTIREVLDDMQAVTINGLGTLSLKHKSAYISNKGQTLSPPRIELCFSDNIDTNSSLLKKLVDNFKISKERAQEAVKSFNQKVVNAYANYGRVNIEGIGILERTDQGKISFNPDKSFVGSYYIGYPEIAILPISKREKEKPVVKEVVPPVNVKNDIGVSNGAVEKSLPLKEVFALKETVQTEPKTSIIKSEPKPVSAVKPASSFKAVKEPAPTIIYEEPKRSFIWPLLYLIGFFLFLLLLFKACTALYDAVDANKLNKEQGLNVEGQENVLEGLVAEDSLAQEFLDKALNSENKELVLPTSGKCKIITGVFARPGNINRRSDLITRKGYELYKENFGPYTRVGLLFDCDRSTDLENYVQTIRKEIDPFSWYLDPSLYVEYQ